MAQSNSLQTAERIPSQEENAFMNDFAIPILDKITDSNTLEKFADSFWSLCVWENDRAKALDQKASSLLGLSSIAAAVLAVGGDSVNNLALALLSARAASLLLFALTVASCIYALFLRNYGEFLSKDIFLSLSADKDPVGDIRPFQEKDSYRCYLRETTLQRWLIYKWHSDANDKKAKRVWVSQLLALLAVLSLLVQIIYILFI
jgi:hypothetical protein